MLLSRHFGTRAELDTDYDVGRSLQQETSADTGIHDFRDYCQRQRPRNPARVVTKPSPSFPGWGGLLSATEKSGVRRILLFVADSIDRLCY